MMGEPVQRIPNRRRRQAPEQFQFIMNIVATVLLAGPMILESIKSELPEHYFGMGSALLSVANASIGVWRLHVQRGQVKVN